MDGRTDSSSSSLTTVSCEEDKWTDERTEDSSSLTTVSCEEEEEEEDRWMDGRQEQLLDDRLL